MKSLFVRGFLLVWFVAAAPCLVTAALPPGGNWPAWRGDGSGISGDTGLPVTWNATNRVLWHTPLPGEGSSSPIVWGRRAFVTASTAGGTNRLVLCLDAEDGRILWQRQVLAARIPRTDPKSGYAPATPATDGQRLYVFFDAPGLMAFDLDGRPLWTLPLGPFQTP
jgi:outer membrane protein assembly factor BamB